MSRRQKFYRLGLLTFMAFFLGLPGAWAGESDLIVPDLSSVPLIFHLNGHTALMLGLIVCAFGAFFGIYQFGQLKKMPVHQSMKEISELIYSTCKAYLIAQGKFLLVLEVLIGGVMVAYFGWLRHFDAGRVALILVCSLIGIAGSYSVAWFGMRINTLANSRCAFASLEGKPFPVYSIPLQAGMSIGMLLISIELFVMLCILLFINPNYAGPCFIGFAIGESLGASVLRIAGGIFTKIADIGSDLMKIVFNIKEDDARNPGVIADCVGDNAGDSVGPTADGFETYGVTGVALIAFILLAVKNPQVQAELLVWIFSMRLIMLIASGFSYEINHFFAKRRYANAKEMNFEDPLTSLVWITSIFSIILTYVASYVLIPNLGDGTFWWKLATIITCGTLAGAVIPEGIKVFTSMNSDFVKNIYECSKKGGTSLNILSGLVAGNYSAYWMGLVIVVLMALGYFVSLMGLDAIMIAPAVFAFGLVAFGFLGMGAVTIAVDSYGPVSDNAQSIYELSLVEAIPNIKEEIAKTSGFTPNFELAKHHLEANDGAGNTFKATSKPVLIGTAVVGATTMIFSIIMILTRGLTVHMENMSVLYPPLLLGLLSGGGMIFWFSGASIQAVTTGAYHTVQYIKEHIKLEGTDRSSKQDSTRVVEICTMFAQKGMINIFVAVLFMTLAFACLEPYFFIGYLISIAVFGLFQAIFMANAGGAWDNAKKLVEVTYQEKGTELHAATVVGDTVGDPFKDTSSVAINPIIKFTTLFGLLAIEIAIGLGRGLDIFLAVVFFGVALFFLIRSFYEMRISAKARI
ncbi:MAG: sodium-translocating pyrophosphatase [Candidatus Omnitrophica bacterium]|nr:sodium-translocating pyrophosphatase [Candidatus Omnitrophota bacterium]MDE2008803.1 sodium-translocating pyrophosphatase [Candidatus Omnitrophota bacterium]MDE2213634.1 sodium-translocating pyrophosphatase [Candidatus Omnitrophota bacterium]MDE2230465.1 sodium-translocating pyrophosphatase [Candidatus Omnitrophota bacterium]